MTRFYRYCGPNFTADWESEGTKGWYGVVELIGLFDKGYRDFSLTLDTVEALQVIEEGLDE